MGNTSPAPDSLTAQERMRKALVAALLLLLVGALIPVVTGRLVENEYRSLDQLMSAAGFTRIAGSVQRGWLSTRVTGRYAYELRTDDGQQVSVPFLLTTTIDHGPVILAGDDAVVLGRLRSRLSINDQLLLSADGSPAEIRTDVSWDGEFLSIFELSEFNTEREGFRLQLGSLAAELAVQPAMSKLRFSAQLGHFEISVGRSLRTESTDNFLEADLQRDQSGLLSGYVDASVGSVRVIDKPGSMTFQVESVKARTIVSVAQGLLNADLTIRARSAESNGHQFGEQAIDLRAERLEQTALFQSVRELVALRRYRPSSNQNAVESAATLLQRLGELMRSGPLFVLEGVVIEVPGGRLQATAKLGIAPGTTFSALSPVESVIKEIEAEGRFALPLTLLEDWLNAVNKSKLQEAWVSHGIEQDVDETRRQAEMLTRGQLSQWIKHDLVVVEGKNVRSAFFIGGGYLAVNGKMISTSLH